MEMVEHLSKVVPHNITRPWQSKDFKAMVGQKTTGDQRVMSNHKTTRVCEWPP